MKSKNIALKSVLSLFILAVLLSPMLASQAQAAGGRAQATRGQANRNLNSGVESIGTHWSSIILELTNSGLTRIGDLDLNQLLEDGRTARWVPIQGTPTTLQSGSRQSAYYADGDTAIHYSTALRNESPKNLAVLELHEILRYTHHRDSDYSMSTALNTLANVPAGRARSALANLYGPRYFRVDIMLARGGTGVSGGGDTITLTMKNLIIQNLLQSSNAQYPIADDFLLTYPSIGFEPLTNPEIKTVYIHYTYLVQPTANGRHEFFAVFIPTALWNQGGAARASVIDEASRKITSLFQVSPYSQARTFVPEGCRANQVVTYPATNDPAVASIQSMRGSIQLGCRRFVKEQTSIEGLAPALPQEVQPESAGSSYFDCKISYRGASQTNSNVAAYGITASISDSWSFGGDDYLAGELIVSKTGEMLSTGITYRAAGTSNYQRIQDRPTVSGHGKSTLMIDGSPLVFECQRRR